MKSSERKFGIHNSAHHFGNRDNSFLIIVSGHVSFEDLAMTETCVARLHTNHSTLI